MNPKAAAARERKAAQEADKSAAAGRVAEANTAAEWKQGSNVRGAAKSEAAASKSDDAARKKREKAALLAADEEAMGPGKTIKSVKSKAGGKKKKGSDLSLLEDALVGNAEKKSKEKKKAERAKKEREERMAIEREKKAKAERAKIDPLMANTDAMIGSGDAMEGASTVGRAANVASMGEANATGVDSALAAMSVAGGGEEDKHPEKRMKALHMAFEERMMPEMKADYPGLKRQQYKNKIFELWKKSKENPMNNRPE